MGSISKASNYLGKNLRFLRDMMQISQEEAARMLHMSRASYCSVEMGSRNVTLDELRQIRLATKIDIEQLTGIDLKKQMVLGLMAIGLSSDARKFMTEYFKLSSKGRHLIGCQIRRLAGEEKSFLDHFGERASLL